MSEPFERRLNEALDELIHGRPIEGEAVRATALRTLTGLFLEAVRRDPNVLPAHFSELMAALLPRVSTEIRAEVAVLVAHSPALPGEIANLLAADDYDVAGTVLRQSPLIDEQTLFSAATGRCRLKAKAVAGRGQLSSRVVAALLDRGDAEIAATLAACQSELDGGEASRIALYPDLPAAAAERLIDAGGLSDQALAALFWRVGPEGRRRIVSRFARRRDSLPPDESGDGPPLPEGNGVVAQDAISRRVLGTALLQLAGARRRDELASRLAGALGLSDPLARRIVEDRSGEALAVAVRAADLSIEHVTGIVLLTAPDPSSSYDALRQLVDLAERLSAPLAGHLVSLWREALSPREVRIQPVRHEPAVAQPGARRRQGTQAPARPAQRGVGETTAGGGRG